MFAGGPGIVNAGNAHLGQETLAESQWVHVLGKHVDSENMRLDVRHHLAQVGANVKQSMEVNQPELVWEFEQILKLAWWKPL